MPKGPATIILVASIIIFLPIIIMFTISNDKSDSVVENKQKEIYENKTNKNNKNNISKNE